MNFLTLLICVLVLASGCAQTNNPKIVANVGSEVITFEDFLRWTEKIPLEYREKSLKSEETRRKLLEQIIDKKIAIGHAKSIGIPSEIGITNMPLTTHDETNVLRSLIDRLNNEDLKITDQEILDYYQRNANNLLNPSSLNSSPTSDIQKEIKSILFSQRYLDWVNSKKAKVSIHRNHVLLSDLISQTFGPEKSD